MKNKNRQGNKIIKGIQKYNRGQMKKAKSTTVISEKKKLLDSVYKYFTRPKPKPKKMWNNKKEMRAYKRKRLKRIKEIARDIT